MFPRHRGNEEAYRTTVIDTESRLRERRDQPNHTLSRDFLAGEVVPSRRHRPHVQSLMQYPSRPRLVCVMHVHLRVVHSGRI
jgi:hypothetical protein